MRCAITIITASLLLCSGPAAAGDSEERTFLECGVQLGGRDLAYKPDSAISRRGFNMRQELERAATSTDPRAFRFDTTQTYMRSAAGTVSSRARTPPVMAIARFGCAWL